MPAAPRSGGGCFLGTCRWCHHQLLYRRPLLSRGAVRFHAVCALAKGRILGDAGEVIRRAPDIILGSWCGKRFRPNLVAARAGWDAVPAVRDGELHEIKSPIILQPGPAALTDGLEAIHRVLREWSERQAAGTLRRLGE